MNANRENRESELLARVNELQKKVYDLIVERDNSERKVLFLIEVLRRAAEDKTGLMSRTICRAVFGGDPTWNPK